jgi:predicted nucleic-acid-binding Zn-ribbon protein
MTECPKCLHLHISGPYYTKDLFGRESLLYRCQRCGYTQHRPTADKSRQAMLDILRK